MIFKLSLDRGRFVALVLVTVFALAVMWAFNTRKTPDLGESATEGVSVTSLAAPVVVETLKAGPRTITDTYAGMIRPFERYLMAFEIGGRVRELGQNDAGEPLDEGDLVQKGQVLAVLDQRILEARVQETVAVLEQAQEELERAKQLRNRANRVISETEFRQRITDVAIAEAQAETANKNLEDATLRSPCNGRISRRYINAGESINMHAPAFEIVEVDRVLLVVGVPESRITRIENRWKRRQSAIASEDQSPDTTVQLMGKDLYGKSLATKSGEIYRISETADDKTGLFEVEILLDNPADDETNTALRPGQIALAEIIVDELAGYELPLESVLFRDGKPAFFTVTPYESNLGYMFWDLGDATDFRAIHVPFSEYVEQGSNIVIQQDHFEKQMLLQKLMNLIDDQLDGTLDEMNRGELKANISTLFEKHKEPEVIREHTLTVLAEQLNAPLREQLESSINALFSKPVQGRVVTAGQHRLVNDRRVRIVAEN